MKVSNMNIVEKSQILRIEFAFRTESQRLHIPTCIYQEFYRILKLEKCRITDRIIILKLIIHFDFLLFSRKYIF